MRRLSPCLQGVLVLSLLVCHALAASAQTSRGTKPAPATIVNLNTATVAELQVLPGVGAKTAAQIVEYRQKNGAFKKIEELMNVKGIGEKSFLKLKSQISVGSAKPETKAASPSAG